MDRATIYDGQLWVACTNEETGASYVLKYPLTCVDGSPASGSYRGEAHYADGNRLLLGSLTGYLSEYRIAAEPTRESVEHADGYLHAYRQKRRVAPRTRSADWLDGWRTAWAERRPLVW